MLHTPLADVTFFHWQLSASKHHGTTGFSARLVVRCDNPHVSRYVHHTLAEHEDLGVDRRFDPPLAIEKVKRVSVDTMSMSESMLGGSSTQGVWMAAIGVVAFVGLAGWQNIVASIMGGGGYGYGAGEKDIDEDEMDEVKPISHRHRAHYGHGHRGARVRPPVG